MKTLIHALALSIPTVLLMGLSPEGKADPKKESPTPRETHLGLVKKSDTLNLQAYGTHSNFLVRPGLIADRTGRVVRITAETTALKPNDPVEFPLITQESGKDYEALALSFASALDIHEALRFIGLEPGTGVDSSRLRFWPKGDRVRMVFNITETGAPTNSLLHLPVEQLILDTRTQKPLPETGLVFTGSAWVPAEDPPTGKVFAADAFSPGSIASVYNEEYTVLDVPRRAPQHDVYTFLVPNPDRQLPAHQLVEITLEPFYRDTIPHRFDLSLTFAPGAAGPIYSLLDSQGHAINSNRSLNGMLAALSRYSGADKDPFVAVIPDDACTLKEVQTMARLLDSLDNDKGIRVEPPPAGHPFFRAFLPDEKFRKRDDRFDKVAELHLATAGGLTTGELVLVESEWKGDDSAPVFHETRIPVPSASALEPALKTRDEAPTVLLIFAPAGFRYGPLREFCAPALKRNMILYVFAE